MLTSPYDFPGFVEQSGQELEVIARERGEDYVNNFDVGPSFNPCLAKGGCFIATAAYGSPLSAERFLQMLCTREHSGGDSLSLLLL
jgi:hypothetical protein